MKKILTSLGMIAFAGAIVASGTGAFFSDTETSTGNIFTAGSVTVDIKNISHQDINVTDDLVGFTVSTTSNNISFAFSDLKPLDHGKVIYELENGANEAFMCVKVEEKSNHENGRNSAEIAAGDTTSGAGNGELGQFLSFNFGTATGTLADIGGSWQNLGIVGAGSTTSSTIEYGFGVFNGSTLELDPLAIYNLAQTDSLTADISFYAVQTRHNAGFDCASLNGEGGVVDNGLIGSNDLYTGSKDGATTTNKWMFWNDTNDTVMSINQFASTGGVNDIVAGPEGVGAARMVLDAGTQTPDYTTIEPGNTDVPRYNIATFQFKDVKLSTLSSMKYRVYNAVTSIYVPFLTFAIDFDNSDTWQRRLVQVPTGLTSGSWEEVDALAGAWTLSGGNWPVGTTETGTTSGSVSKTWAQINYEYPNAETRSTDSYFGIRVGNPGAIGDEAYVDWVEFDGVKYDFGN